MANKNLDLAQRAIDKALNLGAKMADAVVIETSDTSVSIRLGNLESVNRSESKDLGIRVFLEDKNGYKSSIISSNNLSEENINDMVASAIETAKLAPSDDSLSLASPDQICKNVKDLGIYHENHNTSLDEITNWAKEAEAAALENPNISNSEGSQAAFGENKFAFVTSNGFAEAYNSSGFTASASMIAGEGTDMQTDYEYSFTRNKSKLASPSEIGRIAAENTVKKLNPRKIETQKLPIIFDKKIAKSLLSNLCGGLNGRSVVKESSFLSSKMGKQIFPSNINIIDDPAIFEGLGSQPFDAEAIEGKKMHLIENGILKNWITDLRSAKKLGLEASSGRASRGISSHPSPSSSNVYMENGEKSVEELISEITSGLYLTEVFGMGINGITGDYSQGASGFWIENGEIQFPVSEITIAGHLLEMFKNMEAANDLEMRYAKNCPTLRIDGMTIAGN